VLSGNEGAIRLEEILSILHVEGRIAHLAALVIAGREIDGDAARVIEDLRLEHEVIEGAAAKRLAAILQPQHARERGTKCVLHLPHQARISR